MDSAADSAAPVSPAEAKAPSGWTVIARYNDVIDAQAARLKIERDCIPCELWDTHFLGLDPLIRYALGGVRLAVPSDQFEAAQKALSSASPEISDEELTKQALAATAPSPEPSAPTPLTQEVRYVLFAVAGFCLLYALLDYFRNANLP